MKLLIYLKPQRAVSPLDSSLFQQCINSSFVKIEETACE
jgi:hypothetical protein